MNDNAKWIWIDEYTYSEQYVRFLSNFDLQVEKFNPILKICAETDYVAYLNGKRVGLGQFAGWRDVKYFDEISLAKYCLKGENRLEILVRYEGLNSFTHIDDGAGVIFCVENEGTILLASNKQVKCCLDGGFAQGEKRVITWQLGYASHAISSADVEYLYNAKSKEINKKCIFLKRTWQKPEIADEQKATLIDADKMIYDLGKECAGYLFLTAQADKACEIKIAYSEHLDFGEVKYVIEDRDFSLDFKCKKGLNEFEQVFTRIAGRYLQVICKEKVEILSLGIQQTYIPLTIKENNYKGLDKKIYDVSVQTLRLCMHHHYEDCPWREQALYVLDSRNQMLCSYYAFKEFDYQRANLVFMSKGLRNDGMLPICFPSEGYRAIPFFSIMFPVSVAEYVENTGDCSIIEEVLPTVEAIFNAFISKIDDKGIIENFSPDKYWNFYEWTDGLVNYDSDRQIGKYDAIINLALLYAIIRCKNLLNLNFDSNKLKDSINKHFYNSDNGLYFTSNKDKEHFSSLTNALAVLVGLGDDRIINNLKYGKNLIPATLSMKCFVYDALLKADEHNSEFVLEDIRTIYKKMLDSGATTFWETEKGWADFNGAGSLCHGWSALPIYYLRKLTKN